MPKIEGFCHEDFQEVKQLFKSKFLSGEEENAQLCVYVRGELVIDIWGSRDESNSSGYGHDSLQVVKECFDVKTHLKTSVLLSTRLYTAAEKVLQLW